MDPAILCYVQKLANELDAAVEAELAAYSDAELLRLLKIHLDRPHWIMRESMKRGSAAVATFAAASIHRVLIRRAEAKAMEAT